MHRFLVAAALTAASFSVSAADNASAPVPATQPVLGAYYPGYEAPRYPVARIPADRLTHVFYAFAQIRDGVCTTADADAGTHFTELAALKRAHPHLRVLISIGGWDGDGFSDAALTAASRERLVASCLAVFFDHPQQTFDGVDLDWEYPVSGGPTQIRARPQDRRNMTLLAQAFRRGLDRVGQARGRRLLLTAALPAGRLQIGGPYDPARSFELAPLARTLDFINLMAYDMGTPALRLTSLNAPLREDPASRLDPALRRANTVQGAIDYYLSNGVPARSLVLGMPFHGRGYRVTTDAASGLYQPFSETFEPGSWRMIRALAADPAWQHHWHPLAQSPWLYQPRQHLFVTYENPRSIGIRARLAKDRGLRGVFMWELTGDDDSHTLLRAMVQPFGR